MAKTPSTRSVQQNDNRTDAVGDYAKALTQEVAEICATLRSVIDRTLLKATCRIWHGGPVWFIEDNPVVGYSATSKKTVKLLFWNGQSFDEPALKATGKFKAAQVQFENLSEMDLKDLRRWIKRLGR